METQAVFPLRQIASRLSARFVRRAAGRAAGVAVIAVALMGALPRPAAAQSGDRVPPGFFPIEPPLSLHLTWLECVREGDDGGSNVEPYVVIYIADLRGATPRGQIVRTPVLRRMDRGERRDLVPPVRLWGFDVAAAPMPDQERVIFLVQMMEHDRRMHIDTQVGRAGAYLDELLFRASMNGLPRNDIARLLSDEMYRRLRFDQIGRGDDCIGRPVDLILDPAWLDAARRGGSWSPELNHQEGTVRGGPQYRTHFLLRRG